MGGRQPRPGYIEKRYSGAIGSSIKEKPWYDIIAAAPSSPSFHTTTPSCPLLARALTTPSGTDGDPVILDRVAENTDRVPALPGIGWNPTANLGFAVDAAIGYSRIWTKTFTHKSRNATITSTKRKQLPNDGCGQYVAVPVLVA